MTYFWYVCAVALIAFLIQSVTYIVNFARAYNKSLHELETYYDEDEGLKIKWVRFCYIISMLTILFVLVYLCLYWFLDYKMEVASVYTIWWLIYMLYLTSNFISFIGSHKLVLDAFAHKALSAGELIQKISENKKRKEKKDDDSAQVVISESEIRKLEAALKQWVDKKSFREYDKSREDIARELNTTKEILHHYFISIKKVDFKTWRTELRIEEAKRLLLKDKNVSTNIIAEASGFSDRSNFHRQFVKIVGCSPKQWRDSQGHPAGI
jgi:AraC-like DNA-binding protein